MASILVVDDEKNIREVIASILGIEGYTVHQAGSYEQAIDKLDTEMVDLVLTDILLGGKSGIDILNEVNGRFTGCPVIVMTGAPSIETASDAVRLGADNYITKPFSLEELLARINAVLRRTDPAKSVGQNFSFGTLDVDMLALKIKRDSE